MQTWQRDHPLVDVEYSHNEEYTVPREVDGCYTIQIRSIVPCVFNLVVGLLEDFVKIVPASELMIQFRSQLNAHLISVNLPRQKEESCKMFVRTFGKLWMHVLIAFFDNYTTEGFEKSNGKFVLPDNLTQMDPATKRKFTICNLFANQSSQSKISALFSMPVNTRWSIHWLRGIW